MKNKIFALKVPYKIKNTMEFISSEVNIPLSKLYFSSIECKTKLFLGIVALNNLDITYIKRTGGIDEIKHLNDIEIFLSKDNISPIKEFIRLMNNGQNKTRMRELFHNIMFEDRNFSYQDINIGELCTYIGEKYLNMNKKIVAIDTDLVKNIFLDKMLKNYYDIMAIGTFTQLEREWLNGSARLGLFKNHLLSDLNKQFLTLIVEPIELEEAVEVTSADTRKADKRTRKRRKKRVTNK